MLNSPLEYKRDIRSFLSQKKLPETLSMPI